MRNKRPTRDDKVPVDVPKMLGEYGRRIMTQLINDIFEIWKWPKDFTEVTMIVLKKPNATKCSHHHTISLTAHPAKTVERILKWGIERKNENVIREAQFGFRTGKETRDATGVLRISELTRTQARNCVRFINWQKTFYV